MRLFIAIDLPQPILKHLTPLMKKIPLGKLCPLEQLHLTLSFLGNQNAKTFTALKLALQKIVSPSFNLHLKGVGCFPNAKFPRILWVGIEKQELLFQLKEKIEAALAPFEFEKEPKKFHPHITLARIKKPDHHHEIEKFLNREAFFQSQPFAVNNFQLYSSQLHSHGATHTIEASFDLMEGN